MSDPANTPPQRSRWPLILGGLLGGFLLVGAGLGLGWYLFYRPIVNVAVQLPAPAGPDTQAVKALEDQIDKQKVANKQIEDQIAALKDRLRADVCTAKDPGGKGGIPQQSPMPPGEGRKI
jgi:serine protease Do